MNRSVWLLVVCALVGPVHAQEQTAEGKKNLDQTFGMFARATEVCDNLRFSDGEVAAYMIGKVFNEMDIEDGKRGAQIFNEYVAANGRTAACDALWYKYGGGMTLVRD